MNTKIKEFFVKYTWIVSVVIGFGLRLFELTRSSIWHDEGYTVWLLRYNILDIISRTARDVHPPGYYLIAKPWVGIFGTSVFSIRFLSLIFSVGIIYLSYKIIATLWDKKSAYWTAMFVAFSPFLVRFGQEARMYGVVAFFTTLATYYFIRYVKDKKPVFLIGYTLAMIVAMYTQYYSFFVIISIWLIYAIYTTEFWKFHWIKAIKEANGVFDWKWWLANITLLALYLPWFPVAYKQVTRVGGSYWIKPEWITEKTIPANVAQFISYTHLDLIYNWGGFTGSVIYWLIMLVLIGVGGVLFLDKKKRFLAASLYIFGYLPMILVFTLSKLRTPIYQDRYFPFSAIAIFAIWGCVVATVKNKAARVALGCAFILVMIFGLLVVRVEVNHQMKQVTAEILSEKQPGDQLVSGSLYTFLDGSYYLGYDQIKFMSKPVDGYGESSLFYDQQNTYVVNPALVGTSTTRVWVLGKTGEDYIKSSAIVNWPVAKVIEKGNVRAVLYTK